VSLDIFEVEENCFLHRSQKCCGTKHN